MEDSRLIEEARRIARTVPELTDEEGAGIHEYKEGRLKILCRGEALTVYMDEREDPVILITSRGTLLHIEESARQDLAQLLT